jgi:hypothetical protein
MGVPRAQFQALNDALDTVVVNAQAVAAADLALGALGTVKDQFSSWSLDNSRRWAADQVSGALADVNRFRGPFVGMPGALVNDSAWDDLRHAIGRAYNTLWSIQDNFGDQGELAATASYIGDVALGTIQAMPGVISASAHYITDEASQIATGVVGGVASGLIPLWPIIGIVTVLGIGAVLLRQKGVI